MTTTPTCEPHANPVNHSPRLRSNLSRPPLHLSPTVVSITDKFASTWLLDLTLGRYWWERGCGSSSSGSGSRFAASSGGHQLPYHIINRVCATIYCRFLPACVLHLDGVVELCGSVAVLWFTPHAGSSLPVSPSLNVLLPQLLSRALSLSLSLSLSDKALSFLTASGLSSEHLPVCHPFAYFSGRSSPGPRSTAIPPWSS